MAKNVRSRKKKSIWKSTFYRVYFALVGLALLGIVLGTVWLRGVLADYESAQPIYVAEETGELFEKRNFDALYSLDTSAADISGGDKAFYVASMQDLTQGKTLEWEEAFSASEDVKNYAVLLDDERFATFSLVPSGQTTRRGSRLWKLDSVSTNVVLSQPEPEPTPEPVSEPAAEAVSPEALHECRITVPEGYHVSLDGVALSSENAAVSRHPLFDTGFLPEGVTGPVMTEFVAHSALQTPEIVVTRPDGTTAGIEASANKEYTWTCMPDGDETFQEKYSKAAYSLAQKIAKFTSRDGKKEAVTRYIASRSPADTIFDNLSNRYTTPHKGVSFRNQDVGEFYVLSDSCFTCRVSFDFVMNTKNGEMVFPTTYTFCFIKYKDTGKLYNLQIY